jgi:LCP family protein required for cell wall assembly
MGSQPQEGTEPKNQGQGYYVFRETPRGRTAVGVAGRLIRIVVVLALFIVLLAAAAVVVGFSPTVARTVNSVVLKPQKDAITWNGTDPVNMVVMGLDQRPGESDSRTDTMMVISINPANDTVHSLSIPRDLYLNVPGQGYERINSAYEQGNVPLVIKTLEGVVDTPIRYYAIMNFGGFARIVNAFGCVTVDVTHEINDPTFPAWKGNGFEPLHIPKGVQQMCGRVALKYVRERHDEAEGDIARNLHQQQLLQAVKQRVPTVYAATHIPEILTALHKAIRTDFPYNDLLYLGRTMMMATGSRTVHKVLQYSNNAVSNLVLYDGYGNPTADVLQPSWPRIHAIARKLFFNRAYGAQAVQVLNGGAFAGAAGLTARWLQSAGFRVSKIADAAAQSKSEVILRASGDAFVARMASEMIQAPVVNRAGPGPGITVILGSSWENPAQG